MSLEPQTFHLSKKNPSIGEYHGKLFDYIRQAGQEVIKTRNLAPAISLELPDYKYQYMVWPLNTELSDALVLPTTKNFAKVVENGVRLRFLLMTEPNERGLPMAYAYMLVYQEGQAWVPILPINLANIPFLGVTTPLHYKKDRVPIHQIHNDIWCPMTLSVNNGLHGFAYQKSGNNMDYLAMMWHQKIKNEAATGLPLDEMAFPIAFHLQNPYAHHNVVFNTTENVVIPPFYSEPQEVASGETGNKGNDGGGKDLSQ